MPQIPRPPKANNNRTYVGEVQSGKFDIIDAEIDQDFNDIYGVVNGHLDDANINVDLTGIKIVYEKLNLTGKIKSTDLAPGFKVPSGSVDTPELKDLSVTKAKLAYGAVIWSEQHIDDNNPFNSLGTTETVLAEVTFDARNAASFWIVNAEVDGAMVGNANEQFDVTWRLRIGGTGVGGSEFAQGISRMAMTGGISVTVPFSRSFNRNGALAVGATRIALTGVRTAFLAGGSGLQILHRRLSAVCLV